MRYLLILVAPVAALASAALAGEPPVVGPVAPTPVRRILGKQPKQKKDVKPALCPICGKAYYLHAEEGFQCIPRVADPDRILRVHHAEAKCPVCGLEFRGPLPGGWGKRAVYDRDFCIHAPGTEVVFCSAWLCVRCGYAAPYVDFNRPVDDEVKKFVKERISPATFSYIVKSKIGMPGWTWTPDSVAEFVKMRDLPEILIYSSAIEIEKQRDPPPERTAKLYVEASHACRRAVCSFLALTSINLSKQLRGLDVMLTRDGKAIPDPGDVASIMVIELDRRNRAVAKGRKDQELSPEMRYLMYLRLAGACDRLGDGRSALVYIDKGLQALSAPTTSRKIAYEDMKAVAAARRGLMEREAAYQKAAVADMIKALEAGVYKGQALRQTIYMIGELSRRLGDYPRAVAWLRTAGSLTRENTKLSQWIKEALSSEQMAGVSPSLKDAEAIGRVLEAIVPAEPAAPEAEAAGGAEEAPAAAVATGAPADCADAMARIYKALKRYRELKGDYPAKLDALVAEGLLSREAAGNFACVATGARLIYRKPRGPDDDGLILFHVRPTSCRCKKALRGTGEVIDIGR